MTAYMFQSVFQDGVMNGTGFFIATACSLAMGLLIAILYSVKNKASKSFMITLVLLPAIVQLVIMMVNGNIGAGLGVAGAFGLVRFRSAPASGQEIASLFLSVAVGLATGMGYVGVAVIFAVIISLIQLILQQSGFGTTGQEERVLRITIPEDLDFEGIFGDVFEKYTEHAENTEVKTVGMGAMYKLEYRVILKKDASVKEMLDQIRQRNGNLEVFMGRPMTKAGEL